MPQSTIDKLFALKQERNNQMDETKELKPTVIIKNYFGLKEGEDLKGFLEELKELSAEEKMALAVGIDNGSFTY